MHTQRYTKERCKLKTISVTYQKTNFYSPKLIKLHVLIGTGAAVQHSNQNCLNLRDNFVELKELYTKDAAFLLKKVDLLSTA